MDGVGCCDSPALPGVEGVMIGKDQARSVLVQALATLARNGTTEQREQVKRALDAFNLYSRLDPCRVYLSPRMCTVCLHCGKPYEETENV